MIPIKRLIDIFAENYAMLSKFALTIVEDKIAALDVMQNVALIILSKAYDISNIKNPTAFLITCVRRASLNYLRRESRTEPTDPTILEETHSDENSYFAIDYVEWVMLLNKFLDGYAPELQNAFIKYYVDGSPLIKLANELNMTPNALTQQFKRMRERIAARSPKFGVLLMILSSV